MSTLTDLARGKEPTVPSHLRLRRWHALPLRFSERRLLLGAGDLASLFAVLTLMVQLFSRGPRLSFQETLAHTSWYLILGILWLVFGTSLNVYDLIRAASPIRSIWFAGRAALFASAAYLLIPYVTPALPERRLYIFLYPALNIVCVGAWRLVYATLFVQPAFHQRAVVVGAGRAGQTLAQVVMGSDHGIGSSLEDTGYQIVGFVDDDLSKQGMEIAGISVLGTSSDLCRLAKALSPQEIVVALTNWQEMNTELFNALLDCHEMGIPITMMASLYERLTGRVPVEHTGRNLSVVLPDTQPPGYRVYLLVRRVVDILLSLAGCLFLALLIPPIWLANRVTSRGDLFYRQERVGVAGQTFQLVKFRSMNMHAERDTGAVWATENDPRVTLVGRILRKTRLDEIPQFWNVLMGEMTLIGPRPERPYFVAQLSRDIPFYRLRHAVKPGLTGWAQVAYRYGASVDDARVKLEYDLYYIKHQSLFMDLQILFRTIQVVLGLSGQ